MSYKQRNTLILLIQLLLISLSGAWIILKQYPDRFTALNEESLRCERILAERAECDERLAQINFAIEEKRVHLGRWNKTIDSTLTMADVLSYLNDVQQRYGDLKFTLTFVREAQGVGYGYKIFSFNGEGDWESIFSMIWTLENGPKLFVIEKLTLRAVETMEEDSEPPYYTHFKLIIPFSMQVRAVFSNSANTVFASDQPQQLLLQMPTGDNIFNPAIIRDLPPNDRELLECERAELKAVLIDKVMIADHFGKIHSLSEGDPVYLGYLLKIDRVTNCVEFLLNKGGIVEKFKLTFNAGTSPEKPEKKDD